MSTILEAWFTIFVVSMLTLALGNILFLTLRARPGDLHDDAFDRFVETLSCGVILLTAILLAALAVAVSLDGLN